MTIFEPENTTPPAANTDGIFRVPRPPEKPLFQAVFSGIFRHLITPRKYRINTSCDPNFTYHFSGYFRGIFGGIFRRLNAAFNCPENPAFNSARKCRFEHESGIFAHVFPAFNCTRLNTPKCAFSGVLFSANKCHFSARENAPFSPFFGGNKCAH